ncbi:hypothetical protein T439DRAFT_322896 [Meredithblackwellia eburnea MCA 4105]
MHESTSKESPFSYSVPPAAEPALDQHLAPLSLLSSPPLLIQLADTLLALKVRKAYRKEISALSGELRDEWKGRAALVKGDWMARIVINGAEGLDEGAGEKEVQEGLEKLYLKEPLEKPGEEVSEDPRPPQGDDASSTSVSTPLPPTIMNDHDELLEMSSRVDAIVESEFSQEMKEAEGRIRKAVYKSQVVELEMFLGMSVLQALEASSSDEAEAVECVQDNLRDELEEIGWDGGFEKLEKIWRSD